jgi:lipopolysaccharide export system permease protein
MNKIILNYLIKNFLKTFLIIVLIIYCFGLILNLFEEIEFFKNLDVSIFMPLMLAGIFVPSMITKLLPFIIFVSSMVFMLKIRNNKDLLVLKIYGYSNIKIFFILAFTSFLLGWLILITITPFTSSMVKYYEQTKSQYARDIDHLVSFNKNGLWIKENTINKKRIINASKPEGFILNDVMIFHLDEKNSLIEKIFARKANIETNDWILNDVTIYESSGEVFEIKELANFNISSIYDYNKITSLFKNFDTMSFLEILINYKNLIFNGYNERFLVLSLNSMLTLPFFLFLMTGVASILTMHTLKKSNNSKFMIIGLIICVLIYYFKDLSLALGQTDRVPLILAVWSPVIALSFFTFIGVLQINEK